MLCGHSGRAPRGTLPRCSQRHQEPISVQCGFHLRSVFQNLSRDKEPGMLWSATLILRCSQSDVVPKCAWCTFERTLRDGRESQPEPLSGQLNQDCDGDDDSWKCLLLLPLSPRNLKFKPSPLREFFEPLAQLFPHEASHLLCFFLGRRKKEWNDQCTTKSHKQRRNNCRLTLQLSEPIVAHDVMGRRNVSSRATSTSLPAKSQRKRALLHMRGCLTNGGTKQPRHWLAKH